MPSPASSLACLTGMAALVLAAAAPPAGWSTCGGLPPAYNNTACPLESSTCCTQNWMPSDGHWGCCPYKDAVCCEGGYTCCPSGTTCNNTGSSWREVSYCVAPSGAVTPPGHAGGGQQVCKTGGPVPFSTTKKNVVILGDSVSIGYEPFVASIMQDVALVQHSPWGGDGGAEETQYGWQCLDNLLAAPDGTPQRPDVIYFNWGLHNTGSGSSDNNTDNGMIPGQSGSIAEYGPYLDKIAQKIASLAPATKALFGITTPMMCSKAVDDIVMSNNKVAAAIMAKYNIPTVDMHAAVTGKCGPAPNSECFNQSTCFCPHCPQHGGVGYTFLAKEVIVPAIMKLL